MHLHHQSQEPLITSLLMKTARRLPYLLIWISLSTSVTRPSAITEITSTFRDFKYTKNLVKLGVNIYAFTAINIKSINTNYITVRQFNSFLTIVWRSDNHGFMDFNIFPYVNKMKLEFWFSSRTGLILIIKMSHVIKCTKTLFY